MRSGSEVKCLDLGGEILRRTGLRGRKLSFSVGLAEGFSSSSLSSFFAVVTSLFCCTKVSSISILFPCVMLDGWLLSPKQQQQQNLMPVWLE